MPISRSSAAWHGDLKSGKGTMVIGKSETPAPFSFNSRFEGGQGFNPEELLGAAHAGCFSMALANKLAGLGAKPNAIRTTADVKLEKTPSGFAIVGIVLTTDADVDNIDGPTFTKAVDETKVGCPVSKALSAIPIEVIHRLTTQKR